MKKQRFLSVLIVVAVMLSAAATLGITAGALGASFARLAEMKNGSATLFSETTQATGTEILCNTNDTVTITVTPNPGFQVKSVTNNIFEVEATATENVYRFHTLSDLSDSTVTVVFEPANSETLDFTNNSKTLDQNYKFTVAETKSANVSKVKLSWEITDIQATRTDDKVWDTEDLCWKTAKSDYAVNRAGSAAFTVENYSSVKVNVTAAFEALNDSGVTVAFDETTGTDGKITLDTANGNAAYSAGNVPKGVITVTVTPSVNFFKGKSATATPAKYGTYTVTIGKLTPSVVAPTANVLTYNGEAQELVTAGSTTGGTLKYALCDGLPTDADYSESLPAATEVGDYTVWYRVFEDDGYEGSAANIIDVTICKQPVTVTAPTANDLIYNGEEQELITAGSTTGGTLKYAVSEDEPADEAYSETLPTATEEGEYTVWYKSFGTDICVSSEAQSLTVTIRESDCLAKGTKITMADGSLKNIEDISEGDEVLTYNHEEGRYEAQKVYLAWAGKSPKRAFTLHFTDGIEISVVGDHCFFEQESLSYVAVFESTAENFVGKHFYNATAGKYEELLSVTYGENPVDFYEIYTEYNANCIAEGMLNVAFDTSEILNIYEFNEDLTVDHDRLASDIAEYGIFEYVENGRYSEELYDALGWKYFYVMVGKGLGTEEKFHARMDAFLAD